MNELIAWTSTEITRRRFLRRASVATFGALAGLSVGVPRALAANCCTGPYGTGYCGSDFCTGHTCHSHIVGATCDLTTAFCPGGSGCWTSFGCSGTCCDCHCGDRTGGSWYCYCHDGGA
jgi:hypothetical protein